MKKLLLSMAILALSSNAYSGSFVKDCLIKNDTSVIRLDQVSMIRRIDNKMIVYTLGGSFSHYYSLPKYAKEAVVGLGDQIENCLRKWRR